MKIVMQKMAVLALFVTCALFNINVFGLGGSRSTQQATTVQRTQGGANKGVQQQVITKSQGRRGQKIQQRPVNQQVSSKQPVKKGQAKKQQKPGQILVDRYIWNKLSEDQQKKFNDYNVNFIYVVNTISEYDDYKGWRTAVIDEAKKIIDINKSLKSYCIKVIDAALDEAANMELDELTQEDTAQIKQIEEDNLSKKSYIKAILQGYVLQQGTMKEQFDSLMQNISMDPARNNLPSAPWIKDVIEKAIKLVEKEEITVVDVRDSLTDGFIEAYDIVTLSPQLIKIIDYILNAINKNRETAKLQNSPEYVNSEFQRLLLGLSDASNWDTITNRPNEAWVKDIVAISKKMMTLLHVSLDDLERQIGAQVYFVTVQRMGKFLTPKQSGDVVTFVTSIKEKIKL